jgi:hypothetical protein
VFKAGSFAQRYVKRHQICQNLKIIRLLDPSENPNLTGLFEGRIWGADVKPDSEHGASLSMGGVRKLAKLLPDTKEKLEFMAWLEAEFPAR